MLLCHQRFAARVKRRDEGGRLTIQLFGEQSDNDAILRTRQELEAGKSVRFGFNVTKLREK